MSKIVSVYSIHESVDVLPPSILPQTFVVRRAYEGNGSQVIIDWTEATNSGNIVRQTLLRKTVDYPADRTDGVVVADFFDGDGHIVSDLDVEAGICYYYRLFIEDITTTVSTHTLVQGEVVPITTGFFARKLYSLLPEFYKNIDKRKDLNERTKLPLSKGASGTSPEVYNFNEDGSTSRGQLQRFLKVFGPILDEVKSLITHFPIQLDPDTACISKLPFLAGNLGLDFNGEISIAKARNEVKSYTSYLKLKGTKPGFQARFFSVSGQQIEFQEGCDNLLYSNDTTRTSLGFTTEELDSLETSQESVFWSPGFDDEYPFWLFFRVFLCIDENLLITQELLRKWCLVLEEGTATCRKAFLYLKFLSEDTETIDMLDEDVSPDCTNFLITSNPLFLTSANNDEAVTAYACLV